MRVSRRRLLKAASMAVVWLAVEPIPAAEPSVGPRILIKDFMFAPMALTTKVGAVVTWVNEDDEPHTIVSDSGLFRSGALDTEMTYAHTFEQPGHYGVFCSIHPQMKAMIIVQ